MNNSDGLLMRTDRSFVPFLVPAQPWSTVLHTNIAQLLEPASDTRQLSALACNIKRPVLVYNHGSQRFWNPPERPRYDRRFFASSFMKTAGSLVFLKESESVVL
jgi:hypothetical protein